jgi:tRNA(Ile)-lysidine synthase
MALAHCNFSLRGQESDGDEALVRSWAEKNSVRLFVKRFDTEDYAREKGISIEMAARDLRYSWFAELCQEHGFGVLAVAHNANDNAETMMLNLLRGTGLNGLHGMAAISTFAYVGGLVDSGLQRPLPTSWAPSPTRGWENANSGHLSTNLSPHMLIFRPLLEATRKQIEGYVLAHRVPYRHDSSNFESDYKRNKIRNEVFPVFEKINPSFVRTLNREIGYFSEAGQIVEDWCRSQLPLVVSIVPAEQYGDGHFRGEARTDGFCPATDCAAGIRLIIDTDALLATSHWRYLLYYILNPYGFNSQVLASVENLLMSSRTVSGKRFESEAYVLLTGRGTLQLMHKEQLPEVKDEAVMVVRGDGVYNFNGCRFKVETRERPMDLVLKQPEGVLLLDADKLSFPFICRKWHQGDWLVPFGMRGKKKVSDIFADLKYDALSKDAAIIIVDTQTPDLAEQQHVSALLGVRIDERYKVTSKTRHLLYLTLI